MRANYETWILILECLCPLEKKKLSEIKCAASGNQLLPAWATRSLSWGTHIVQSHWASMSQCGQTQNFKVCCRTLDVQWRTRSTTYYVHITTWIPCNMCKTENFSCCMLAVRVNRITSFDLVAAWRVPCRAATHFSWLIRFVKNPSPCKVRLLFPTSATYCGAFKRLACFNC